MDGCICDHSIQEHLGRNRSLHYIIIDDRRTFTASRSQQNVYLISSSTLRVPSNPSAITYKNLKN